MTKPNLAAIAAIVGGDGWEKLLFNTLAGAKYPMLGMVYPLEDSNTNPKRNPFSSVWAALRLHPTTTRSGFLNTNSPTMRWRPI